MPGSPEPRAIEVGSEGATVPAASVVIPTTGRRVTSLARLLDALSRQDANLPVEVIVVSDGPRDALQAVPKLAAGLDVRSVVHGVNRGRAAACNSGIAVARGETILLLDDDMEPAAGWLRGHLFAHARSPAVGVIGAAPIAADRLDHPVGGYFARRFKRHLAKLSRLERIGYRDVYTGNFSISRSALRAVGGFDEGFTAYGNEDGELALRLMEGGTVFVYEPQAVAVQHHDKDLPAAFADSRAKGRTAVFLAKKHPGAAGDLRLSQPGSRKRRAARRTLVLTSRVVPFLPGVLVGAVALLERTRSTRLDRAYDLLFDFGYWLGVDAAGRQQ